MEDTQIIDLFFSRDQQAIQQTEKKYGRLCYHIAWNILSSREDAEESVSDTYLNRFLDGLPQRERVLFVSRYWYLRSVKQMAEETGLSESSVKTQLFRTREKLRRFLDKEGLL